MLKDRFQQDSTWWIDLLDRKLEDHYARDPGALYDETRLRSKTTDWIVIDEIQKVPRLLDTVHRILESREFSPPNFALTGSSARKLRHGGANLLAGRAFLRHLFPLTETELGVSFDLQTALNFGSLPKIASLANDSERDDFLASYGLTYLNEEIWAEHLVQELDPFRKFLEVAAQSNGQVLNYAKIARDVHVNEKTVRKYFQILEDTLVGFVLEPYSRSVRKRQVLSPKFFLFDLGVKRALERSLRQRVVPGTYAFGRAFEHLVIAEFHRLNDYGRKDCRFSYFLTKDGGEIDLVIERPGAKLALVEIKSATQASDDDTRYLRNAMADFGDVEAFCLSLDPSARNRDGVTYLPWQRGLKEILGAP